MLEKKLFTIVIFLLTFGCATTDNNDQTKSTASQSVSTTTEIQATTISERERTPLLLISIDGFRHDYFDIAETPVMDKLIQSGVKADYLLPIYPSNTFPNHYSLVTGLYAENTGIIANSMYDEELGSFSLGNSEAVGDGRWYGGEPIWVTAETQGVSTATMFWPGSEAAIKGVRPTRWMPYDGSLPYETRVDSIITWLTIEDDSRPDFMTLYFSRVDSRGHSHGAASPEVVDAIEYVDGVLGYLIEELERIGMVGDINMLITSDHGMASLSEETTIFLDDFVDLDEVRVRNWSSAPMIQPRDLKNTNRIYQQLKQGQTAYDDVFQVYLKEDIPERYRFKNHPRVPEILIVPDVPYTFTDSGYFQRRGINAGTHGWDPDTDEMRTIFFATGPGFKQNEEMPKVNMVDIYELMCHLLGLEPAENDGSFNIWHQALE